MPKKPEDIQNQDLSEGIDKYDDQTTDPRLQDVEDIVAHIDRGRKEEMGMDQDAELDPEKVATKPEEDKATDEQKPKDELKPEPEPDTEVVTVKIDGVESQVPKTEVDEAGGIRAYQMEKAAEARLKETKTLLSELKELKASIVKPTKEKEPDDEDTQLDDDSTRKPLHEMSTAELREAIRYGEDDEADAAIEYLLNAKSTKVSPDDIKKMIRETSQEMEFEDIVEKFKKDPEEGGYSDLFDDPILLDYANNRVKQLQAQGKSANDWKTYEEAGNWVRETVLGQKPPAKEEPDPNEANPDGIKKELETSPLKEKIDKKRKLTNISPASQTRDSTSKKDDRSEDQFRRDTIAEMRKEREFGR